MMREVPEHYQERIKELFGDECFFRYLPFLDRFCVTSRIPGDWEATCTLFIIEHEGKFRPINDSDLARVAKSRLFNDDEKTERLKRLADINAKEKRDAAENMNKEAKRKGEAVREIGKDLSKNPIMAQAFLAEANRKFATSVDTDVTGKSTVTSKRRSSVGAKGKVVKKIK